MNTEEKKLPEDFKKKWVEALRSGEYEQGQRQLYNNGKYCCLGVACRIAGISVADIGDHKYPDTLGPEVSDGLPDFFRLVRCDDPAWTLANKNDKGESFSQLADYIEQNL